MSAGRSLRILRARVVAEQRIYWRNRSSVLFSFVFPLFMLAFFGAFADPDVLLPGIAALIVTSVAFQTLAIQLAMHRDQGVLKRTLASPLPPLLFVAGKACSVLIVAAVQSIVVVGAGMAFFALDAPVDVPLLIGGQLLGVAAFVAVGFALANVIPNADAAPALVNAAFLPMMLISGVFYPVEEMPRVAQLLAQALPLVHLVDLVRGGWLGTGSPPAHVVDAVVLAAWSAAAVLYTLRSFRWQPAWEG